MTDLILAVDDEPLLLRSYQRTLGDSFNLVTADGPERALEIVRERDVAIILTDLKMPGMDGIAFLRAAREIRPDAVRMMISGHADMGDAINSVNQAGIFRLMLKPCPDADIAAALRDGLAQHRLVTAEKQLLEGTLNGAIQCLTDILGILDWQAYGEAQLRRRVARSVALALRQPAWTFEIAALLADIGRATLPPALNEKLKLHQSLNEAEHRLVERVPEFSARLLHHIPRIDAVVEAVLYQDKHVNGDGFPADTRSGRDIPVAGRALHAIKALLALRQKGTSPTSAIGLLKQGPERYDPEIVLALYAALPELQAKPAPLTGTGPQQATLTTLGSGMNLLADITTRDGMVVLSAGTRLTDLHIQRVKNFAHLNPLVEPFLIEHLEA
jgi:response regulator RpfG family c-di-GMP phosphodiesterase